LLADRDKIGNLDRGLFKYASYQVSVHLAMRFQSSIFLILANQKQELPVAVMLSKRSGRNEQSL
jgi:hypothetical protein